MATRSPRSAKPQSESGTPLIPKQEPLSPFQPMFSSSIPVVDWSADDLAEWLRSIHCGDHIKTLEENHITGEIIMDLSTYELKQLVPIVGDRIRLAQAITRLRAAALPKPTETNSRTHRSRSRPAHSSSNVANGTPSNPNSNSNAAPTADYFGVDSYTSDPYTSNTIRFSYSDGKTRFVDISGMRTANDIKLAALRKIYPQFNENAMAGWRITCDGRTIDNNELLTIARHPTNKLLSISHHQAVNEPGLSARRSSLASSRSISGLNAETSAKDKDGSGNKLESSKSRLSRPTSRQVSSNLREYFPEADPEELRATIRKSMIFQRRLSLQKSDRQSRRLSNLVSMNISEDVADDQRQSQQQQQQQQQQHGIVAAGTTQPVPRARTSNAARRPNSKRFSNINLFSQSETIEEESSRSSGTNAAAMSSEEKENPEIALTASAPKEWFMGRLIGSGSFGTVYMGVNKLTGELMAVKQVKIPEGSGIDEVRKKRMVEALQHEVVLMKDFDHENIVQYIGFSQDADSLNIFLEYVPGGSLASMLSQMGHFEETLVQHHSKQILAGLSYLHERQIIHRDIKGANILVDNKGCIKISDFGLSKKLETQQLIANNRHSMHGSAFWMAPEVVKQQGTTAKADVWSFGCLLIEMFTGNHPFPKLTQMQAIYQLGNMTRPEIPASVSASAKSFLELILQPESASRPSANELLRHPFLN